MFYLCSPCTYASFNVLLVLGLEKKKSDQYWFFSSFVPVMITSGSHLQPLSVSISHSTSGLGDFLCFTPYICIQTYSMYFFLLLNMPDIAIFPFFHLVISTLSLKMVVQVFRHVTLNCSTWGDQHLTQFFKLHNTHHSHTCG